MEFLKWFKNEGWKHYLPALIIAMIVFAVFLQQFASTIANNGIFGILVAVLTVCGGLTLFGIHMYGTFKRRNL